jgi:lipopolysaccharide transport system permease protein
MISCTGGSRLWCRAETGSGAGEGGTEMSIPVREQSATAPVAAVSGPPSPPETIIEPGSGRLLDVIREIWDHRELLYFLAWRDVKVRYKQTVLGVAWVLLQPALLMVVFTLSYGRLAGALSSPHPYPLFVYAGVTPWCFFAAAYGNASSSVMNSEVLVTKVYFPRLILPLAAVGATLLDVTLTTGGLGLLLLWYGIWPGWSILLVPVLLLLTMLAALGVGTLLAALNITYRDVRYLLPYLAMVWMLSTPTIYLPTPLDEESSLLLKINPMNGLIASFRAAALGDPLPWRHLALSVGVVVVLLGVAGWYFHRTEDSFADII